MKNNNHDIFFSKFRILISFIVILMLSFSSCKKKKEMVSPVYRSEKVKIEDKILNSLTDFETFQAKTSVNFNDGKKDMSVGAQIKIFKNSKIQISVQPFLGIELFKLEITNDSIKVVDKINKRYMAEPYSQYNALLPVPIGVSIFESLFLNNIFVPGEGDFTMNDYNKFKWTKSSHGELTGDFIKSSLFNLSFNLNNNSHLSSTVMSVGGGSHKLDWKYSNFQNLEGIEFPFTEDIVYTGGKKKVTVQVKYQKIELNKNISDKFDIPRSYKKMTPAQILEMLLK